MGEFEEPCPRGKARMPQGEGAWDSEVPGEGDWVSHHPEVNRVTESKPIKYVNGEPVLKPYAKEQTILKRMTGMDKTDFPPARRGLMEQYPGRWKNVTHLENWETRGSTRQLREQPDRAAHLAPRARRGDHVARPVRLAQGRAAPRRRLEGAGRDQALPALRRRLQPLPVRAVGASPAGDDVAATLGSQPDDGSWRTILGCSTRWTTCSGRS